MFLEILKNVCRFRVYFILGLFEVISKKSTLTSSLSVLTVSDHRDINFVRRFVVHYRINFLKLTLVNNGLIFTNILGINHENRKNLSMKLTIFH